MSKKDDLVSFKSSFLPNLNINVIFKENPHYPQIKEIFDMYGYGFLAPEFKTIFIDGEIFLGEEGFSFDDLKFIEAHEVSHLILNHDGPRNEEDEIEADLGAYILLKNKNMSTERLEDEFENRHGIPFSEELLSIVKDRM
jgi:Zn-dependent peptidase ImmA (M78 family)